MARAFQDTEGAILIDLLHRGTTLNTNQIQET